VPSYVYQDRIIGLLSFGWSVFFFTAFIDPKKNLYLVKAIIIAGVGAILGLCVVNLFTDFNKLSENIIVSKFWIETGVLSAYLVWLIIFYFRSKDLNQSV